jgi:hypothetical protein
MSFTKTADDDSDLLLVHLAHNRFVGREIRRLNHKASIIRCRPMAPHEVAQDAEERAYNEREMARLEARETELLAKLAARYTGTNGTITVEAALQPTGAPA